MVKAMVFPVVRYGCESWAIKKAKGWRIGAFELWCWKKLLRVPWTARRSNQSILKEISPEYSLEGLMLKLKIPILWPPGGRNWLIGKDPDAGKDWRQEEKGMIEDEMIGWHHWFDGHEFEQAPGDGDRQGSLVCCCPQGHKELDTTERLSWTELISCKYNQNSTTLCHHHCYILVQDKFISLLFSCNNFWSSLSACIFPNCLPPYSLHSSWNHPF